MEKDYQKNETKPKCRAGLRGKPRPRARKGQAPVGRRGLTAEKGDAARTTIPNAKLREMRWH